MFNIWAWENFKWRTKVIFNAMLLLALIFWVMMFFQTDLQGTIVTLFKIWLLALLWNWFSYRKSTLVHMSVILMAVSIFEMFLTN